MARVGGEAARGGEGSPIEESAGFALVRACRSHRGAVGDVPGALGLYPGQEMVLLRLWREDELGHSELAERVGVEASTMSNMLMRLERAGLVERRRAPDDARHSRALLTPRGRALRVSVEEVWAAVEARAFRGMPHSEELALRRALTRARANLVDDTT